MKAAGAFNGLPRELRHKKIAWCVARRLMRVRRLYLLVTDTPAKRTGDQVNSTPANQSAGKPTRGTTRRQIGTPVSK
jgi:hypothetical protein